jgi:adenosylmethionine-8-amino-7-oxononanoate aminotransferase
MSELRFPDSPVFYRILDRSFLEVVRGDGVFLYDAGGRAYIDGCGGALVVNIGHGRKEVANAMAEQAGRVAYAHGSMFTTKAVEELSETLVGLLPENLDKVYLVHGGTEATETAIKLARQFHLARGKSDKYRVVGLRPGYHGNTLGALAVSGREPLRRPYEPMLADFPRIPAPYCYRCPWHLSPPECGVKCADELDVLLEREGAETFSAFIAEPIGGSSTGAAVPPPEYLPRIREICTRHDLLFIADEVLTGMGRTGRYLALEHFDVVPDMVLLGKGLSSGYMPAGAVGVGSPIVETVRKTFGNFTHGYTYSHHAVAAATCREVLAVLKREHLVERAVERGRYLFEKLQGLERFSFVGDVRGRGLLVGVELVADRETKKPFPRSRKLIEELMRRAFEKGLLIYPSTGCADGVQGELFNLAPPLVIEEEEIDQLVSILIETFEETKP